MNIKMSKQEPPNLKERQKMSKMDRQYESQKRSNAANLAKAKYAATKIAADPKTQASAELAAYHEKQLEGKDIYYADDKIKYFKEHPGKWKNKVSGLYNVGAVESKSITPEQYFHSASYYNHIENTEKSNYHYVDTKNGCKLVPIN